MFLRPSLSQEFNLCSCMNLTKNKDCPAALYSCKCTFLVTEAVKLALYNYFGATRVKVKTFNGTHNFSYGKGQLRVCFRSLGCIFPPTLVCHGDGWQSMLGCCRQSTRATRAQHAVAAKTYAYAILRKTHFLFLDFHLLSKKYAYVRDCA